MSRRESDTLPGDWLDPADWHREGRGRRWEFKQSTQGIVDAVRGVAARRDDRFDLLVCFREGSGRDWKSKFECRSVEELSTEGPWQHFIRSRSLTAEMPEPRDLPGSGWPAVFATNGLLLLHHPDPARRNEPDLSSIGVVNRVGNDKTGEVIEHAAYDKLFAEAKRALKAAERRT